MDYVYAYATLDILFGLVWLLLFLLRKDLRHEQWVMSFLLAPAGLTEYWFYNDYWRPEWLFPIHLGHSFFGLEDILFCFFIGGICAVLYEALFRKRCVRGERRVFESVLLVLLACLVCYFLKFFGFNTIWATLLDFVALATYIVWRSPSIRADAALSAAGMFLVVVTVYTFWFSLFPHAVARLWVPTGLSGFQIIGIPIEEILWYSAAGFLVGVFYEFVTGTKKYRSVTSRDGDRVKQSR